MELESEVARHYTCGGMLDAVLGALRTAGKDPDNLHGSDLFGADELHIGWQPATADLAQDLKLSHGMKVLDVGAGVGGPARHLAEEHGAQVTGIDLSQEFVDVATELTRRCGLSDRASFRVASGLDMPFEDGTFDRATMIHVGMNIRDKDRLFAEVRRVVKPGGLFAVYDIMRVADAEISYPMPWADTEATSFVERPETYRSLLRDAGFEVEGEKSRREMALTLAREMREKVEREGPPPLSVQTLMGPQIQERIANVLATLDAGTIAPIQMLARAV